MANNSHEKEPLYKAIVADLRRQIESGELAPGDKAPSTRGLCRLYGVSTITALAAVRELVADGFLQSRPRSGVFVAKPSSVQSELPTNRSLVFLMREWHSPFLTDLMRGAEEASRAAGYRLMISHSDGDPALERQLIGELSEQTSGLIIIPTGHDDRPENYEFLLDRQFPFVLLDNPVPGITAPCVTSDNVQMGVEATAHLLERLGEHNTQIYALYGQSVPASFSRRLQGFRRALKRAGVHVQESMMRYSPDRHEAAGFALTQQILQEQNGRQDGQIGIFALNEAVARGCYVAIQNAGLRIPEDVLIAGCDDTLAIYYEPPMTTVPQQSQLMGKTAARLLVDSLATGRPIPNEEVLVPVKLTVRASTCLHAPTTLIQDLPSNLLHSTAARR